MLEHVPPSIRYFNNFNNNVDGLCIDDAIIDEILNYEDDRRTLQQQEGGRSYNAEDSINRIVRKISSSAPNSALDIEKIVREEMAREQELMRDRRKKDIHNMIERRRRYNINDRIKELGTLLPKTCIEMPRDSKLNKGSILKASVDYIKALQRETQRLNPGSASQQQQTQQPDDEKAKLLAHIQELEKELQQHGLPVPKQPKVVSSSPSSGSRPPTVALKIKQEPIDHDLDDEAHGGYSPQSDVSSSYSSMGRYVDTNGTPSPPLFSPTPHQQHQGQLYPSQIDLQQHDQQQQQQRYFNLTPQQQQALTPAGAVSGSYPPSGANFYGFPPQQLVGAPAQYAMLATTARPAPPVTGQFGPLGVSVAHAGPACGGVSPVAQSPCQIVYPQQPQRQAILQHQRSLPQQGRAMGGGHGLTRNGSSESASGYSSHFAVGQMSPVCPQVTVPGGEMMGWNAERMDQN